jgi:hypothetical protein
LWLFYIFLVKFYNCFLLILHNNLKVSVPPLWYRQLDLIKPRVRAIFYKSLHCLIWPKKVASALTSDLFEVLLPFFYGTNLTLWEKLLLALRDKTAKLTKSSKATVQRNSLRRLQFKRTIQIRGFSSSRWSQLCQTSKSNLSQEILKRGSYAYAVIFKPSRLLTKGRIMSLAKAKAIWPFLWAPDLTFY